jgi:branched-chain amino acid transport system substrate-binding protein
MTNSTKQAAVAAVLLLTSIAATAHAEDKPEVVIGSVVASTGPASALGIPERNAIALFEEELAKRSDLPFKVRFVTYDDSSDPTRSVASVRKLIDDDRAHIVICCTTTPSSMAILDVVKGGKTPNMALGSAATIVEPASERFWTFKTVPTESLMFKRIFDHMKAHGIRKVAFAGLEDSYGESGKIEFERAAAEYGIEIVASARFSRTDTNFTPQALRLSQADPDAVYFHAIPPSANLAHQALTRVGYRKPIYHGAGVANWAFLGINSSSIEGALAGVGAVMVYDQLPAENVLKPILDSLVGKYKAKFGAAKADMFTVSGWDSVLVSIEAMKRAMAAGASPKDIEAFRAKTRDAIETIKEYPAATGIYNYSANDHLGLDTRGMFVAVVRNGRFEIAK